MKIIDLTHTITETMPVYPGTEPPVLSVPCTIAQNGYMETLLHLYSHTGTHMDAPAHMVAGGATLDSFPAGQFVGTALVIDCTALGEGGRIGLSCIEKERAAAERVDFLLFRTDWDKKWDTEAYFGDFPCISAELADFIVKTGKKGIGLDVISVDPINSKTLDNHTKILSGGRTVIIENLYGLDAVGTRPFTLVAAPLKFAGADGAPARVLALVE